MRIFVIDKKKKKKKKGLYMQCEWRPQQIIIQLQMKLVSILDSLFNGISISVG